MTMMIHRLANLLILFALALFFTFTIAPAAEAPQLRTRVTVESDFVTLGDLFENAGPAAAARVFRAPDPGETGVVSAARVAEAADRHGLVWRDGGHITQVAVTRASHVIGLGVITDTIRDAARQRLGTGGDATLTVELSDGSRPLHLPTDGGGDGVRIARMNLNRSSGYFEAQIEPAANPQGQYVTFNGRIFETVRVPVLVRDVPRGEEIAAGDLELREMSKSELPRETVRNLAEVAGMAARRSLNAGEPLRASDLERPRLVQRNSMITLVYRSASLNITVRGRSLDDGTRGDIVRILNPRSKRIVEGMVARRDEVIVSPGGTPQTAMLTDAASLR